MNSRRFIQSPRGRAAGVARRATWRGHLRHSMVLRDPRRAKASLPLELLAASIELREPAEVTGTNSLGRARLYLLSQRRLAVF
jgi:hypothetical protein